MRWSFGAQEVEESIRMVEVEHFDVRTLTMGISLLDVRGKGPDEISKAIYDKIKRLGSPLAPMAKEVSETFGVPIVNTRISLTPISLILDGMPEHVYVDVARAMDLAAAEIGVDYIAGFGALVHKGMTPGDLRLITNLPKALSETSRVCGFLNLASSKSGINMEAVRLTGSVVRDISIATADSYGSGCARFVAFANAVEDNPFIAGAFHGPGEPEAVINVGISGPGVVLEAIKRARERQPFDFTVLAETIKRMSFKITRAGELLGREVVKRIGPPVRFGVVDLSLAPTPAVGDSIAEIIEAMGIERAGAPGTTAALALLTDAVKKGGLMASSSVGGLSGAFIPVSEDSGMVRAVKEGAMRIEKLEAMTSVCSVGLDMVAIPGDTPPETIAAIIADEMAIGVMNHKTTGARLVPVPGKGPGESVDLGGLLGELIVMDVSTLNVAPFINLGGRIPAPVQSFRN